MLSVCTVPSSQIQLKLNPSLPFYPLMWMEKAAIQPAITQASPRRGVAWPGLPFHSPRADNYEGSRGGAQAGGRASDAVGFGMDARQGWSRGGAKRDESDGATVENVFTGRRRRRYRGSRRWMDESARVVGWPAGWLGAGTAHGTQADRKRGALGLSPAPQMWRRHRGGRRRTPPWWWWSGGC